ncbi:hypothetical protein PX52LOC_02542 [Limnoglobus roseus]|uniref:Uncharacterized protein n=1 Tax=Limnoglobus roseus TaxID=2598579 RepID=A0A5C1A8F6_9BACT|nr:hypothetical protein PX52LOC_02542 [Limnoglobus roseus]
MPPGPPTRSGNGSTPAMSEMVGEAGAAFRFIAWKNFAPLSPTPIGTMHTPVP